MRKVAWFWTVNSSWKSTEPVAFVLLSAVARGILEAAVVLAARAAGGVGDEGVAAGRQAGA